MNVPQLKEDWTQAYKWLQTQLGVVILAAPLLYQQFPTFFQPYVSAKVFNVTMAVLGALVILNSIRAKTPAP